MQYKADKVEIARTATEKKINRFNSQIYECSENPRTRLIYSSQKSQLGTQGTSLKIAKYNFFQNLINFIILMENTQNAVRKQKSNCTQEVKNHSKQNYVKR